MLSICVFSTQMPVVFLDQVAAYAFLPFVGGEWADKFLVDLEDVGGLVHVG